MRSALGSLRAPLRRTATPAVRRVAVAAMSVAAATSLALPAVAQAAPSPTAPTTAPKVDQHTIDSMSAFAPALIGSVATKAPDGTISRQLLDQARGLASAPGLPPQAKNTWQKVIDFLGEPGHAAMVRQQSAERQAAAAHKPGDPSIPQGPGAPKIQEFLYPTFGLGCLPGNGNSLGRALTTAGPQQAPAPGPKSGQAGYVYTSLGTGPAVDNNAHPLMVTWLNIDNGRSGQLPLKRNPKINATAGPGTFTSIADTGKGRVISTIYGNVTTNTKGHVRSCQVVPTIGIAII